MYPKTDDQLLWSYDLMSWLGILITAALAQAYDLWLSFVMALILTVTFFTIYNVLPQTEDVALSDEERAAAKMDTLLQSSTTDMDRESKQKISQLKQRIDSLEQKLEDET